MKKLWRQNFVKGSEWYKSCVRSSVDPLYLYGFPGKVSTVTETLQPPLAYKGLRNKRMKEHEDALRQRQGVV